MENVLRRAAICLSVVIMTLGFALPSYAQSHQGGEANLELPDLSQVIFFNGIIGWGLNSREEAEKAFDVCHRCLRPGGHLLIGWNDLPEHRPFRLQEIEALSKFERWTFPPLDTSEHLVANEWRHVFSFFRKLPIPRVGDMPRGE